MDRRNGNSTLRLAANKKGLQNMGLRLSQVSTSKGYSTRGHNARYVPTFLTKVRARAYRHCHHVEFGRLYVLSYLRRPILTLA